MRAPTPADVALLWAAASVEPDLQAVSAAAADADLAFVLDVAAGHRVAPLALRALQQADIHVDPATTPAVGHARVWEGHARLALPAAAAAALGPLNEAGLRPMVLKGLALVARYPAPGLRPMDDIDLLLPRPQARRAVPVLEAAGWRRVRHPHRDPGYDVVLSHPAVPGVPLELHHELARWGERPPGLDAASAWAARVPLVVHGQAAWALPPELEMLALIAHAAKAFHVFGRLCWFVDLAVVGREPAFDWDRLARLTQIARRRVAVGIALRLASRLGADVPSELLDVPPVETRRGTLDVLLDPARPFYSRSLPRWLAYVLIDDIGGKLRLGATDLVRPTGTIPRLKIAQDLAGMAFRGLPGLLRARLAGRRAARG